MSSGACRALVAVVLTLVATIVMTLPVAARTDDLSQASVVEYEVVPNKGTINVTMQFLLATGQTPAPVQVWGPIVVEDLTSRIRVGNARREQGATNVPGPDAPWKQIDVKTSERIPRGEESLFNVTYTVDAAIGEVDEAVPARVDTSYVFLCVPGQETDNHKTTIKVGGGNWTFSQSGTPMIPDDSELIWEGTRNPEEAFTCIEAVRENRLLKETIIGPADRDIELQAWDGDPGWLSFAASQTVPALDDIHRFLGHDIPGEATVIIREAPPRAAGGYASAHDTLGVVQLDETAGASGAEHEMAHAWFGKDNIAELWLREGLAEWIATSLTSGTCEATSSNTDELDLSRWLVVQPTAPEDYEAVIEAQEAAACGIVAALAARMPEETFKAEVLGSMLNAETKYIGSAGPESGTSPLVDFREWLDAVDERGLVPAGKADPAFADNLTDLDFAQNLLDDFGIPNSLAGARAALAGPRHVSRVPGAGRARGRPARGAQGHGRLEVRARHGLHRAVDASVRRPGRSRSAAARGGAPAHRAAAVRGSRERGRARCRHRAG